MNIIIKKYREADGAVKNYFDSPSKIDEIIFNNLPGDAMPRFTQRWIKNDKGFIIQYDNFSLKFSQLQAEVSAHSKNIREFMMDGNNLFVVMVTIFDKAFGGTVIMNDTSPRADNSLDQWNITFDCVSLEAEADRKLQTLPVEHVPQDNMAFEDYIVFYFRNFVKSYITINNRLQLSAKMTAFKGSPYTVIVSAPLQNNIWERGIGANSANLLNSLSKEMGFVWEIKFAALQTIGSNYFNVELKLSWRDGGALRQLDPMTHIENINTSNTTPYILFPCLRKAIMNDGNTKQIGWTYCGVLFSRNNHFSVDQPGNNPKFNVYTEDYLSVNPFPNGTFNAKGLHWLSNASGIPNFIPANQLLIVEPDVWYSPGAGIHSNINFTGWEIVYSRLFVRSYIHLPDGDYHDAGYNDILDYFTVPQNRFLASGAAKTIQMKLSLINNSHYDMFDKMQIGGESYFLFQLEGLDGNKYEAESTWKQITG